MGDHTVEVLGDDTMNDRMDKDFFWLKELTIP
jgi:hypothetical protein